MSLIVFIVFISSIHISYCMTNLTYFNGRNKNLTEVPDLMDIPETVTDLDFSYNNIAKIKHIKVPYPSSIKRISFSHNMINTIVRGVLDNLTYLDSLDLSYNQINGSSLHIETFKYEIGHFERIKTINLRGNHLGTLERLTFTAYGFSTLENLDLSHCFLKTLEHMSIDNLGNLKYLDLSFNALTKFEALSLEGLMELEDLDLSNNKLTEINEMSNFLSLKKLNMDNNRISFIKENIFSKLLNLETLSLRGNNMRLLSPFVLPLDPYFIKNIKLEGNPWHCDCNMRWITEKRSELAGKNFTLKCAHPSRFRRKNILDIPGDKLICTADISRIIYFLILLFSLFFMFSGIISLLYLYRKKFTLCCGKHGAKYVAVYTSDNPNGEVMDEVQIKDAEDDSLLKNEETTAKNSDAVQYSDD